MVTVVIMVIGFLPTFDIINFLIELVALVALVLLLWNYGFYPGLLYGSGMKISSIILKIASFFEILLHRNDSAVGGSRTRCHYHESRGLRMEGVGLIRATNATVDYPPNMDKRVLCLHAKDKVSFLWCWE